jgi:hypothetical protein
MDSSTQTLKINCKKIYSLKNPAWASEKTASEKTNQLLFRNYIAYIAMATSPSTLVLKK